MAQTWRALLLLVPAWLLSRCMADAQVAAPDAESILTFRPWLHCLSRLWQALRQLLDAVKLLQAENAPSSKHQLGNNIDNKHRTRPAIEQ